MNTEIDKETKNESDFFLFGVKTKAQQQQQQQQQFVSLMKISEHGDLLPRVSCHRFGCVNVRLITKKAVAGLGDLLKLSCLSKVRLH